MSEMNYKSFALRIIFSFSYFRVDCASARLNCMYIPHDMSEGEEVNRNTKCRFHLRRLCQNNAMSIEYFTVKLRAVRLRVFIIYYVDVINISCLPLECTNFCLSSIHETIYALHLFMCYVIEINLSRPRLRTVH